MAEQQRQRVVIIGGGFAGLNCTRGLRKTRCDVTLIDRRNFHLFQPLLYQVATGALSPANIAAPLRSIVNRQKNTRVVLADVERIDGPGQEVLLSDGNRIPYDTLVVAAGSTHHYFGKDEAWGSVAPGLKTVEDATEIRRKILLAFERAEREIDPQERQALMTFVVVGGGPTGVEMAGAISELARYTLRRDFRAFNPRDARVILVESQDRVLSHFHDKLSRKAGAALEAMGIELMFHSLVTDVTLDHVKVTDNRTKEERRIPTETVVWAAGVKASPLGKLLVDALGAPAEVDRAGRVVVSEDCSIPGHPQVFVLGDMAAFTGTDGKPLPGVAPVAMQQGDYVADLIDRKIRGQKLPGPFRYWDKGNMATIGRARAVAETQGFRFNGYLAWLAWLFIHIMYLARFENRVLVLFQWTFNYVTRNRAARLITGSQAADESTLGPHPTR